MSGRTLMVLALAVVAGGSAIVLVNSLQKQAPAAVKLETSPVVVVVTDVQRGATLSAEAVKVRDVPKDQAPENAVSKVEDAIGRTVKIPLIKGDTLVEAKLTPKGSKGGMAGLIPKGMRAFTIQTPNIASAVAGFVLPGNKVDVLLTMNSQGADQEDGGATTSTLLQSVEILAVEDHTDSPDANKIDTSKLRSVTLLVTPDQAAMLDLGQNHGTLHLTLRNLDDQAPATTRKATLSDLLGKETKPKPEVKPEPEPAPEPVVVQAPEPPPLPPAPPEPLELKIRTMRGMNWGADKMYVPVDPKPAPAAAAPARDPRAPKSAPAPIRAAGHVS